MASQCRRKAVVSCLTVSSLQAVDKGHRDPACGLRPELYKVGARLHRGATQTRWHELPGPLGPELDKETIVAIPGSGAR